MGGESGEWAGGPTEDSSSRLLLGKGKNICEESGGLRPRSSTASELEPGRSAFQGLDLRSLGNEYLPAGPSPVFRVGYGGDCWPRLCAKLDF